MYLHTQTHHSPSQKKKQDFKESMYIHTSGHFFISSRQYMCFLFANQLNEQIHKCLYISVFVVSLETPPHW